MAPMAYGARGVILSLAELKVEDIIVTLVATVVGGFPPIATPHRVLLGALWVFRCSCLRSLAAVHFFLV